MADRPVTGKMQILFIDPAGGTAYEPVVCLTSNSLKRANAIIDSANFCGPSSSPGAQTVSVDFAGQTMIVDPANPGGPNISEGDLHDLWASFATIGWKIGPAIPVAGDVSYSGTGFLGTLDATNDLNGATFTGSLGIYGLPTKTVEGES